MSANKHPNADLDGLLKNVFADDLPDDVAAGMRRRIAAFRAGKAQDEKSRAAGFWLYRKGLWAALAIGMIVAGFLLQGLQAPSPLAERIALVKAGMSSPALEQPAGRRFDQPVLIPDHHPVLIPDDEEA